MLNVVESTSRTQRKEKPQDQTPHSGKNNEKHRYNLFAEREVKRSLLSHLQVLKSSQEDKSLVLLTRLDHN